MKIRLYNHSVTSDYSYGGRTLTTRNLTERVPLELSEEVSIGYSTITDDCDPDCSHPGFIKVSVKPYINNSNPVQEWITSIFQDETAVSQVILIAGTPTTQTTLKIVSAEDAPVFDEEGGLDLLELVRNRLIPLWDALSDEDYQSFTRVIDVWEDVRAYSERFSTLMSAKRY